MRVILVFTVRCDVEEAEIGEQSQVASSGRVTGVTGVIFGYPV